MDPLGDPLTTRSFQTPCEFNIEPYPCRQVPSIDNPDRQFGNSSVWTWPRIRSDSPEPLLSLDPVNSTSGASCAYFIPLTNLGSHNAQSNRDIQQCHRSDNIWTQSQTCDLVWHRKCESHPGGSEH